MNIEKRVRMAAESILENESIREGINDSGASALLEWGTSCAERIAKATANLEDDDEAEEASYPRMRALREMLDIVKSLFTLEVDITQATSLLVELIDKAVLVYDPENSLADSISWEIFSKIKENDMGQKVTALRNLVEKNTNPEE